MKKHVALPLAVLASALLAGCVIIPTGREASLHQGTPASLLLVKARGHFAAVVTPEGPFPSSDISINFNLTGAGTPETINGEEWTVYRHGDGLSDSFRYTRDGLVRISRDQKTVIVAIKASQEKMQYVERVNGIYDTVKRSAEMDFAIKQFYQEELLGRSAQEVMPRLDDTDSINGIKKSDIAASYLINSDGQLRYGLFAKQAGVGYLLVQKPGHWGYSITTIFAVGNQGISEIRRYFEKYPDRANRRQHFPKYPDGAK